LRIIHNDNFTILKCTEQIAATGSSPPSSRDHHCHHLTGNPRQPLEKSAVNPMT
jgi:hypothetical protein